MVLYYTYTVLLVLLVYTHTVYSITCPALCQCKPGQLQDQVKLRCGGGGGGGGGGSTPALIHDTDNPTPPQPLITEVKDVNLTELSLAVVNLNLSGNSITTLSRDLHLPNLQKLDLSDNKISLIESDAFYNLTGLQKLDLSGNSIQNIYKEIFKGLVNLERLLLSRNKISVLAFDTFDHLLGLKQLDLSFNPLKCDCELLWISEWSKSANVKLMGNPKCASPESLNGQSIKKIRLLLDLVKCGVIPSSLPNALLLYPQNGQLVFEGDSLTLRCKAPFSSIKTVYNLTWISPNTPNNTDDLVITNVDVLEEGLAETILKINNISNKHAGQYVCKYSKENSTDLVENIEVIVISNVTKYCPETVSSNNKGLYTWPRSISGHVVSQPCRNIEGAIAYYKCSSDQKWSQLNTSACPYISETTKMLEQFAIVNLTVFKDSVVSACERLQTLLYKHTPPNAILSDPDDVNFIARAIENFMHYAPYEKELGSILLDVINTVMSLPSSILKAAEDMYGSCSYFIGAIESISQYISNIHEHKSRFAVENFAIKRESFTGITCVWYTAPDFAMDATNHETRMLHCSTTNRTITPLLTVRDKIIEASIQIPGTLLYGIDDQMVSYGPRNIHKSYNLIISMFENANLFSRLPDVKNSTQFPHSGRIWSYYGGKIDNSGTKMAITTPVVGIKLVNMTMNHLLREPVYIMVRDTGISSGGRAVLWDEELKIWTDSSEGCGIIRIIANMVVIQCHKLGYVGLMQSVETGIYGGRSAGARFKLSHPAIYVGSTIFMVCLLVTKLTYVISYSSIHMAAKAKHALINTWLAMSVLCFLYTFGIYQTEDIQLCQGIGLMLHYLTLCCLFWMTVSVSQLYKYLTKNQNDPLRTPDDELPPEVPIQKPILGIYLVGWGISLIVCGISGAVNMRDYAAYSHCFLSSPPALSAVFVPAGIIIVFISILFLLVRCSIRNINGQLSDGTQATENVDLETWEPSLLANNTNADRLSVKSAEESDFEDTEHTPLVQLRAHIIVLCLYLALWTCGTIAIYHPFPLYLPYQEDIFSILYAVCSTILGTFIVFFYGIARSDVRSQWQLMHCYFKKRKQCCRNRSVYDANAHGVRANSHQNLPPISNIAAAQARSRSNSQASSQKTNSKSNNIMKAGAELNGQTLTDTMSSSKKVHNMNLIVLHRQQYRSNNSVTTCQQESVELFYNPNQSNVARKFFKRQRKHMRHNQLEIPRRHNYDSDSQVSNNYKSEKAQSLSSPFVSNSKVNNTNIHIETEQSHNDINKDTRLRTNSNILEQDENGMSPLKYSCLDKNEPIQEKNKFERTSPIIMNIYTNVPETQIPQHQVVSSNDLKHHNSDLDEQSYSVSVDASAKLPVMRTVSQQCSLEYSSASEAVTPMNHLESDKTLNTHSEVTSFPETHSAMTSDTDEPQSFPPQQKSLKKKTDKSKTIHNSKSVEECDTSSKTKHKRLVGGRPPIAPKPRIPNYSEETIYDEVASSCVGKYLPNDKTNASEADELIVQNVEKPTPKKDGNNGFDMESDIYFSNYQMSEVSIQSHGLYAPQPPSICPNDLCSTFSNGELSRTQPEDDCDENQYVNYNPAWRKVKERMQQTSHLHSQPFHSSPAVSLPDVNRVDNDSPLSFASEIDELYKQIKGKSYSRRHYYVPKNHNNEFVLRHCESDSCISESHSDILDSEHKAETRV